MNRALKNKLKKLFFLVFERMQKIGIDVTPHHFYSQIPNIAELKKENYWRKPSSMSYVLGNDIQDQIRFAESCCTPKIKRSLDRRNLHQEAVLENGEDSGYGVIEADFLYCFIRTHRPGKVVQVGCGVSTAVILKAAEDEGYDPEIVCIEPYPMSFLLKADEEKRIRLLKEKAQKVELEEMTLLGENDLLFIDSTHTVKPGSEVNRIILEVLPRIRPGNWVHFHDIYLPYDYKRDVLDGDLFFWSESTLLHAFLSQNSHFKIQASLSMLHYSAPEKLKDLFPKYVPQRNNDGLRTNKGEHFPSSIFLQTF